MQITFKPNSNRPDYLVFHDGQTFEFKDPGVYAVPDDLGKELMKKRPELFGVHDPGENEKAVVKPEMNRMFGKPKKNK